MDVRSGGQWRFINRDPDGMLQTDMEDGMNETYDRLADLMKKM
jgi:hypothetical protein